MAQAIFHCDFDLSSIEVTAKSDSFSGKGWATVYSADVPRIRHFLERLGTSPLDRCEILLRGDGRIGLTVRQVDPVGHLQLQIELSESNSDGADCAQIGIGLDHQALLEFRTRFGLMLDGQLGEFIVKQSTT